MTGQRQRGWRRACSWGTLAASLCVAAPLPGPALARPLNPFESLAVKIPDLRPKRRAAPRAPVIVHPSLPVRKPETPTTPAEDPATSAKVEPAPQEEPRVPAVEEAAAPEEPAAVPDEPATPVQAPAQEDTEPSTDETALAPVPESASGPAPAPPRNPVRSGSDPDAAVDPKVAAALEKCVKLLDGLDLEYEHLDPIRRGACGTAAPIKLKSIGKNPAITVSPPATVNCTVAATLHEWFKTSVQPTAKALGTQVVKIRNAASYMCRNQYGRPDTKLSEHARANALDIKAFVLASGQEIPILGNWPYGYEPNRPQLARMPRPNPLRDHSSLPPPTKTPGIKVIRKTPADDQYSYEMEELKKVATNPFFAPVFAAPVEFAEPEEEEPEGPVPAGNLSRADAKSFLRTIHGDGCKVFWTVLGPEANAAHRDHFHLDMRKRRYVRICQ